MKKNLIYIIMVGVAIIGFIAYTFIHDEELEKEEFVSVPINDSVVQSLYSMANPSNNVSTMLDVYKREGFSNEFILGAAFVALFKEEPNHVDTVTEEEINLYVNKIFGDITYAHSTGYIVSEELCTFRYDRINHNYTTLKGCDGSLHTHIYKELVEAKKSDTEYVLTEKIILTKGNWDEVMNTEEERATLKVYGDVFENKLLKEYTYKWDSELPPAISLRNFYDDASTYVYHFVFDGNSFVYKSIRKVG